MPYPRTLVGKPMVDGLLNCPVCDAPCVGLPARVHEDDEDGPCECNACSTWGDEGGWWEEGDSATCANCKTLLIVSVDDYQARLVEVDEDA